MRVIWKVQSWRTTQFSLCRHGRVIHHPFPAASLTFTARCSSSVLIVLTNKINDHAKCEMLSVVRFLNA